MTLNNSLKIRTKDIKTDRFKPFEADKIERFS